MKLDSLLVLDASLCLELDLSRYFLNLLNQPTIHTDKVVALDLQQQQLRLRKGPLRQNRNLI
ncbi:hypothetical protein BH09PLA1_BH09PLA1_16740 [soil metagenome]